MGTGKEDKMRGSGVVMGRNKAAFGKIAAAGDHSAKIGGMDDGNGISSSHAIKTRNGASGKSASAPFKGR